MMKAIAEAASPIGTPYRRCSTATMVALPTGSFTSAGTAAAARRQLALGEATVIAPADDEDAASGSEALWRELATLRPLPRRVLILRAEQGREWLAQQLRDAGAEVNSLAVYRRVARAWKDLPAGALVAAALHAARPVLVVTSSEAVQLVLHNAEQAGLGDQLRNGVVVTMHPRVAEVLRAAGCAEVHTLPHLDAAALLALAPR